MATPTITGLSMTLTDASGNAYWLGDNEFKCLVRGSTDPFWPGLKRTSHEVPGGHGIVSEGGYLQAAQWPVSMRMFGDTQAELLAQMESLLFIVSQPGMMLATFDSRPGVYWRVDASVAAEATWVAGATCLEFTLTLSVLDPAGYSTDETQQVVTVNADPKSFTVLAAALLSGSLAAAPTYIIQPTGACTGFTLLNSTTGEQAICSLDITAGQFIKIDAGNQETYTSALGVVWIRNNSGSSGSIPRLAPRVLNSLVLTGVAAGTLTINYRERFAAMAR